jgi:hypothetical protein
VGGGRVASQAGAGTAGPTLSLLPQFEYALQAWSVAPSVGSLAGGTAITIAGAGFATPPPASSTSTPAPNLLGINEGMGVVVTVGGSVCTGLRLGLVGRGGEVAATSSWSTDSDTHSGNSNTQLQHLRCDTPAHIPHSSVGETSASAVVVSVPLRPPFLLRVHSYMPSHIVVHDPARARQRPWAAASHVAVIATLPRQTRAAHYLFASNEFMDRDRWSQVVYKE